MTMTKDKAAAAQPPKPQQEAVLDHTDDPRQPIPYSVGNTVPKV